MQRFLIYDDCPQDARELADMLKRLAGNAVILCADSEAELRELAAEDVSAVLFLDIELADSSGIRLAQTLAEAFPQMPLVFFTAHIRYCEDIFTAEPAALLLKPVTEERVRNVLEILQRKRNKDGILTLTGVRGGVQRIPLCDIAYIECIRRKLEIYDLNGRIIAVCTGKKLSDLASLLGEDFICCHQSIYVNMQQIKEICRYSLRLRGGIELPSGFVREAG